ncbi:hypothetical protein ACVW1C_005813 [Bradyrhizobium sp. USDA 4011]
MRPQPVITSSAMNRTPDASQIRFNLLERPRGRDRHAAGTQYETLDEMLQEFRSYLFMTSHRKRDGGNSEHQGLVCCVEHASGANRHRPNRIANANSLFADIMPRAERESNMQLAHGTWLKAQEPHRHQADRARFIMLTFLSR